MGTRRSERQSGVDGKLPASGSSNGRVNIGRPKGQEERQPWELGLFWLLVAAIALATMLVLSGSVRFFAGDVNGSCLFMLSSFLQSLAAVLGIAFTLTLIALQLAAQSYTHRVIWLHTRSVVFVFTFAMLLLAMVFIAVLLASYRSIQSTDRHPWVDLAVVWFVSALVLLIPFAVRTLRLLAPDSIAAALLAGLSVKQLESSDTAAVHVRIGPVFDMARKAIVSRDERTLELLMAQVRRRVAALLADVALGEEGLDQLQRAVSPEFRDLGWLASDRGDIGAVKQVVDCLRELVCRAGARPDRRVFAEELNAAIGDIWKEASARFSDTAHAARLAELETSMSSCRVEISSVLDS
ncbi:DUF2254 domain-containing protein [candidate division WOR-3 bacterium]|uniref:DUF2254 domain-containing protein n=1 Tax=candidate division WOR-3 bacterium TaxID=2052148 RepID=A0A937XEN3_UNCW3|nr:DUF2254 domain-containing protein [candidate division WOR-3 bacterium]